MKKFKEFVINSGLDDGKAHVLLLDGHALHVSTDFLKYTRANNVHLFQLPLYSSHITQLLM